MAGRCISVQAEITSDAGTTAPEPILVLVLAAILLVLRIVVVIVIHHVFPDRPSPPPNPNELTGLALCNYLEAPPAALGALGSTVDLAHSPFPFLHERASANCEYVSEDFPSGGCLSTSVTVARLSSTTPSWPIIREPARTAGRPLPPSRCRGPETSTCACPGN